MKFKITKTSLWGSELEEKEIKTLEEFLKFIERCKEEVIVKKETVYKNKEEIETGRWELEIYDNYRE